MLRPGLGLRGLRERKQGDQSERELFVHASGVFPGTDKSKLQGGVPGLESALESCELEQANGLAETVLEPRVAHLALRGAGQDQRRVAKSILRLCIGVLLDEQLHDRR